MKMKFPFVFLCSFFFLCFSTVKLTFKEKINLYKKKYDSQTGRVRERESMKENNIIIESINAH